MKKILLIGAAPLVIFLLLFMAIVGGGSTGGAAAPFSQFVTEEKAEEYGTYCSKLGTPWEIILMTDAIIAYNQGYKGIEHINPVDTTLNFLVLRFRQEKYEYIKTIEVENEQGKIEKIDIYEWVYKKTDTYKGKNSIISLLEINPTEIYILTPEAFIEKAKEKTKKMGDKTTRYFIEFRVNPDFETVLKNNLYLSEKDINGIIELYKAKYLEIFVSIEALARIKSIQTEFGMYQLAEMDGDLISYDGIIFADGATQVVYYNQMDIRWATLPYGSDTIGEAGCGPTAMAIVISTLTKQTVDPIAMAAWSVANGYYIPGGGSYHSLIPEAATAFGLPVQGCTSGEPQRIADALSSGKLVVVIVGPGTFTSSGHFMVLRGITTDGKVLLADPISYRKSQQLWDLSIFLQEARQNAAAGGPFWIIG